MEGIQVQLDKLVIRDYKKEDFSKILGILDEITEKFSIHFGKDTWTESTGLKLITPGYERNMIVADCCGDILAIGLIEMVNDVVDGETVGYLSHWGVKEAYRGCGVGRILVDRAIEILTSMDVDIIRIKIATHPNHSRLMDLVSRVGFESKYVAVEKRIKDSKKKPLPYKEFKNPPIF